MISRRRDCFAVLALPLLLLGIAAADDGPGQSGSANKPAVAREEPAKPDPVGTRTPLDRAKLPPSSLIFIDDGKDPLRLFPKMILVSPAKFLQYQQMEDRLKLIDKQGNPDRVTPYSCKISGTVEGNAALLQAEFGFRMAQPRGFVTLGCQGAYLTEGDLDGQLPLLSFNQEDGYVVQVEKAGDHRLTLRLKVHVAVRRLEALAGGAEHTLEMGLPGAVATSLNLELARSVKELRWNDNLVKPQRDGARSSTGTIALGIIRNLKLSWKEPVPLAGAGPPLTARWHTTVKIQESQVLTTAELTLNDSRALTREWRVWAPPDAKLKVHAAEDTPYEVSRADAQGTFLIKGPPTEQLKAQVTVTHARPFVKLPVGPFVVFGAELQEGIIEIRAAPEVRRGYHLVYNYPPDVHPRNVPKEPPGGDLEAVFQYGPSREPAKAPAGKGPPGPARLELGLRSVSALVETSVEHLLRLQPTEQGWQVVAVTWIHATPQHDGVDFLDVQLPRLRPPGLQALAVLAGFSQTTFPQNLTDAALGLYADELWPVQVPVKYECVGEGSASSANLSMLPGQQRRARIGLHRLQEKKFSVVLTGTYLLPSTAPLLPGAIGEVRYARLELPRPVTPLDKGGRVKIEVDNNLELLEPEQGSEAVVPERHQYTRSSRSPLLYADLAWKLYVPEFPVSILADVTLRQRYAQVRQELDLHFPERHVQPGARPETPQVRVLELQAPTGVTSLKVVQGGKWRSSDATKVQVSLTGREPLVLTYDFNLPPRSSKEGTRKTEKGKRAEEETGRLFPVPLFWPKGPTRAETKVRVWSDPGTVPVPVDSDLANEPWRDLGTERVKGKHVLPALVLQAEGLKTPLSLRIPASPLPSLASVLAERALVQVTVDEKGDRQYRTRFLLSRLNVQHLDVEFPIPPGRLGPLLKIFLGDEEVSWTEADAETPKVGRLMINPEHYKGPVVLDIRYERKAADFADTDGLWQTTLSPPVLRGDVFLGQVRWQIALPPSRVPLPPVGYINSEQHWGLRGWLLVPEPADAERELDQWPNAEDGGSLAYPLPPTLAFWGNTLEPVHVVHLPQQVWLFLCSGLLLVLGLGLVVLPLSRPLFWLAVGAVVLAVAAAGVWRPALLPTLVYGCQPGAVVLLLILGIQGLLHRHYRRRVVFMPGFTRLKPGSSLVRAGNGRAREVSTVDAPPSALTGESKSSRPSGGGQT